MDAKKAIENFLLIKRGCVCCRSWQERAAEIITMPESEKEAAIEKFCSDLILLCFGKSNGEITPEENQAARDFLDQICSLSKERGFDYG